MSSPLDDVTLASLPADALAALAPLRTHGGIEVATVDGRLWVRWQAGDEEVLRWLLPVSGVELFTQQDGQWYRAGHRLPAFDVPSAWTGRGLDAVLLPAPVQPLNASSLSVTPAVLHLVRDDVLRPASALRCPLDALARWADQALTADIESLRGVCRDGVALVLGERLPPLADGERYWGARVLVPLGHRPEPALPESALCQVLRLADGDVALLGDGHAEVVPGSALQPLTRAGIRLASRR